jgi:GT2 family glycosyltransferase
MSSEPRISVVVPTIRLNDRVRTCIEHLKRQTYRNFDVYVVTDEPESFPVDGLDVRFLASGPVLPNHKRLQAARASDADLIALIDDDAYAVPDWLAVAAHHFADPRVVAAGGPGVTPPEDGPSQRVSGAIYASPLVSAGQILRYVPRALRDVGFLPSCNFLARREPFLAAAAEALKYWSGEDVMLCRWLARGGDRIVYDPAVIVFHHRRPLFWGHFRQVWNYAIHRGFFIKRFPDTSRNPQYCVPALFVAGNVTFALVPLASQPVRVTLLGLAGAYAILVGLEALRAQRAHAVNPLAVALGIYLTHLTYGAGFLAGLSRRELDH